MNTKAPDVPDVPVVPGVPACGKPDIWLHLRPSRAASSRSVRSRARTQAGPIAVIITVKAGYEITYRVLMMMMVIIMMRMIMT